ncbi:MAG TPA: TRAP transporter fused permease subunit [Vicinamibacterales bacterium]|nr:TRAP transporter fused permease subunit [Vicinamibacterales bacterium]
MIPEARRPILVLAAGLSAFSLYWVVGIIQPQVYRALFLGLALLLTFLRFRSWGALDFALAALSVAVCAWPVADFDRFIYSSTNPTLVDLIFGTAAVLVVLEGTRRTVGWVLPVTALAFIGYALAGPWLPRAVAHRGYGVDRLVGSLYMTLEGIFGVPLDVASTYIILFTVYGAVLEWSGAGRFFIDWSLAVMRRSSSVSAPGRTVTLAGFLLGTVSGSGVATTVMLGSVSWPLLKRAGYRPETAGAMLSAAGIGALLSPPTLGAAAFLIAEFLRISYLQVLFMATVPTVLYYLSILFMIEADSRRMQARAEPIAGPPLGELTWRYGYHFSSLVVVAVLMVVGFSAFRAVFWAIVLAVALSFVRRETALTPKRLGRALADGGLDVLPIVATTATAGIIVGVVTLTGLGLRVAGLIVALAGGGLFLTAVYSAVAVWLLGLAVPVTASYIIAAVMVAPALVGAGVPEIAAHMFIFYYAVLSEVSPPTALSPFAAAAITGGNPYRTMMLTWKYTLPAFLVPFVFTLSRQGLGVLLAAPWQDVIWASLTAGAGVAALAAGLGGWMLHAARWPERLFWVAGGLALFYAGAAADLAGAASVAVGISLHIVSGRTAQPRATG